LKAPPSLGYTAKISIRRIPERIAGPVEQNPNALAAALRRFQESESGSIWKSKRVRQLLKTVMACVRKSDAAY